MNKFNILLIIAAIGMVLLLTDCHALPDVTVNPESNTDWIDYDDITIVPEEERHILPDSLHPLAFHNGWYVAHREGRNLYLVDTNTGNFVSLMSRATATWWEAVLTNDYVAWIVEGKTNGTRHIHRFDRQTGETRQITNVTTNRRGLVGNERWLVWMDQRNEIGSTYEYDIYAYDLVVNQEIAVEVAPGIQSNPSISGNRIVWQDNRNSTYLGSPVAGCSNCPYNHFDIYLHDLESGETHPLVVNEAHKAMPVIYNDKVAWSTWHDQRNADLYLFDLTTNQIEQVTNTPFVEVNPYLTDTQLYWRVRQACDVVEIDSFGNEVTSPTGVYVYDRDTQNTQRLTTYKEPSFWVDEPYVLIREGCMVNHAVYWLDTVVESEISEGHKQISPIAFPQLPPNDGGYDDALLEGELMLVQNHCIAIHAYGQITIVLWPHEYELDTTGDRPQIVMRKTGVVLATVGNQVRIGGGYQWANRARELAGQSLPEACVAPYVDRQAFFVAAPNLESISP